MSPEFGLKSERTGFYNEQSDSRICKRAYEIATFCVLVSWVLLIAPIALGADSQLTEAILEESAIAVSTRLGSQISLYEQQIAETKWRRLRGFNYLAKVLTGIKFKDGIEVTAIDQAAA